MYTRTYHLHEILHTIGLVYLAYYTYMNHLMFKRSMLAVSNYTEVSEDSFTGTVSLKGHLKGAWTV